MDASRSIFIGPVGYVESETLAHLAAAIQQHTRCACRVAVEQENPLYAFDTIRCQYNSKLILQRLRQVRTGEAAKFLGVTHVDLYVPILKFVFGLAEIKGPCALISLCRLRPQFYDEPADPLRYLARAEKTALHELGHSLGLTHCIERRCVMFSSTRIEDTDRKGAGFCPGCGDLFQWYLEQI